MILVTSGAGYIGSHTCLQPLEAGQQLLVLDNLSNSKPESLRRVQALAGKSLRFAEGDIRNAAVLDSVFCLPIKAVIHFADLKAAGESVAKTLEYYDNNVTGTLSLLAAMHRHGVRTLVFSSSATVYGDPASVPIHESSPLSATTPYNRSKLMVEDILRDLSIAEPDWNIAILRYFNPVGAHESGQIGEHPSGIPNNLMLFISQVAIGQRTKLNVFGADYPTMDGTGIRDYIHVVDLAEGHLKALQALQTRGGLITVNLGTGQVLFGTGHGQSIRNRQWQGDSIRNRRPPPGRHCSLLGQPILGTRDSGLASTKGLARNVRRRMALAKPESGRLSLSSLKKYSAKI